MGAVIIETLYNFKILQVFALLLLIRFTQCTGIVNKCCKSGERFDEDFKCTKINNTAKNMMNPGEPIYSIFNSSINYGVIPCPKTQSREVLHPNTKNFNYSSGVFIEFFQNKTIKAYHSPRTYCMDQWEFNDYIFDIVYVCHCMEHVCIRKCCSQEEILQNTFKHTRGKVTNNYSCVPKDSPHSPTWNQDAMNGSEIIKHHPIAYNGTPSCNNGEIVELIGNYSVLENATIVSQHFNHISSNHYCGDFVQNEDISENVILRCSSSAGKLFHSILNISNVIALFVAVSKVFSGSFSQ